MNLSDTEEKNVSNTNLFPSFSFNISDHCQMLREAFVQKHCFVR